MKIFSKLYVYFQRKLGNKFHNLPCCSLLQFVVVYKFSEIESTFPVPFWDYVADCLWLRGMVSICLLRKDKYDWFLHEDLLLDWLIFLLCLVQFVCCSKYFAKATHFLFLNLFLDFRHLLVLKYLRISVTVMQSNFTSF